MKTEGYAAFSEKTPLVPFSFERRKLRSKDVQIEILYCGICHSDIHCVKNEWASTIYPIVPGHEIVGVVKQVGKEVKKFRPGDLVAVGCFIGSCRSCASCKKGLEQYCEKGFVLTYNSPDPHQKGKMTFGGYSTEIVVDAAFVLKIPKQFKKDDLPRIAPLVCAGITTYSPLKHSKVKKGMRVGVVGLGGLGHMAIKLAKAMGADVTLFTTSSSKLRDGKRLGASSVIFSKDKAQMEKAFGSLDLIIDTVAASHDLNPYIDQLKRDGSLYLIGVPEDKHPLIDVKPLIFFRKKLTGSLVGGLKETQEMLNFCAKHRILADIELIPIEKVNEAYVRVIKNDVKYRFVIDISSFRSKNTSD